MNQQVHDKIVQLSIVASQLLECVQWEKQEDTEEIYHLAEKLNELNQEVIFLTKKD